MCTWNKIPPVHFFTGTSVLKVEASDTDFGMNAEVNYLIQKGSFNEFVINNETGLVTVASKLNYDRRSSYSLEVLAVDHGQPSLTGTATVSIHITDVNDKLPYFDPEVQKAEVRNRAVIN